MAFIFIISGYGFFLLFFFLFPSIPEEAGGRSGLKLDCCASWLHYTRRLWERRGQQRRIRWPERSGRWWRSDVAWLWRMGSLLCGCETHTAAHECTAWWREEEMLLLFSSLCVRDLREEGRWRSWDSIRLDWLWRNKETRSTVTSESQDQRYNTVCHSHDTCTRIYSHPNCCHG